MFCILDFVNRDFKAYELGHVKELLAYLHHHIFLVMYLNVSEFLKYLFHTNVKL